MINPLVSDLYEGSSQFSRSLGTRSSRMRNNEKNHRDSCINSHVENLSLSPKGFEVLV